MFKNLLVHPWEFFIGLAVFVISSWQAIEAMATLYPQILSQPNSQFTPLKINKSFILTENSNDNCLGYLESNFNRNLELASYSLKGEIFLKIGDKLLPTKFDLESSINVFGQIAASVLRMSNNNTNLTLGLLNVNPIEVNFLNSAENQKPVRKKLNIPGPILLKQVGDNFIIDYPASGKSIVLENQNLPLATLLNIKFMEVPDAKTKCQGGVKSNIDLVKTSLQIKSKFNNLIPQMPLLDFEDKPNTN